MEIMTYSDTTEYDRPRYLPHTALIVSTCTVTNKLTYTIMPDEFFYFIQPSNQENMIIIRECSIVLSEDSLIVEQGTEIFSERKVLTSRKFFNIKEANIVIVEEWHSEED